jgi:hypothetical protein
VSVNIGVTCRPASSTNGSDTSAPSDHRPRSEISAKEQFRATLACTFMRLASKLFKSCRPALFLLVCVPLSAAFTADSVPNAGNTLSSEWRELFNGADLSLWSPIGAAVWRVENGVIVGGQDGDPKRSGLLTTKEQFKDFELQLDFMIDEHGKYNSGVYLRNDAGTARRTGYQVNIGRAAVEEFCGGIFTDKWLAKGDENDSVRKKLAWNTLHILAKGAHLEVTLNGVQIVKYTDPNPADKFLQKGVIGLQTYGAEGYAGWVKFRKIRVRELQ